MTSGGDRISGGYRVTGKGSVLALAWAPSGAELDYSHLFPSQSGRWTGDMKNSTADHEIWIADCLSTRYFVDPADAREDLGNVPIPNVNADGVNMMDAISETTYVGVERWASSGAPFGLVLDTLYVTPPSDWEFIRSALAPASADGELPPIDYHAGGGGMEIHEWHFEVPKFSTLLSEQPDVEIEMFPVGSSDSGALLVSGIRVIGVDSTVSFLQSKDRFISIVQIGAVQDDIGRLFELTSEQFGKVHVRPRR